MPSTPSRSLRPHIARNGKEEEQLNSLLLGFETGEGDGLIKTLRIELQNWGPTPGGTGFVFDERALKAGDTLSIMLGEGSSARELFSGVVNSLESNFTTSSPPSTVAFASSPTRLVRSPAASKRALKPVQLRWGVELLSVRLKADHTNHTVSASGVAESGANVQLGALVEFVGVGARGGGTYRITRCSYKFDQSAGLRAEFSAMRT